MLQKGSDLGENMNTYKKKEKVSTIDFAKFKSIT